MEAQRLTPTLPVQQQSLQKVQNMASDFAVEYGLPSLQNDANMPLLVVIGSERGLCGDFKKRLMHACYSSLLAENRKRVAHLDNAVSHLDEQHERLLHRRNRLYQEDITAELAIIMLADQPADASSLG
jgi:F0F1-type ATP synthase gamma subunit